MKISYTESVNMETYACYRCSMLFSMTADFVSRRREDHGAFYCPQGHSQIFAGDNEKEKLRRQVDAFRQDAARLEEVAERALREARMAESATRLAKREKAQMERRIHSGVCPDCNRTFANVARHMTTKHGGPKLKCQSTA